MVYMRNNNEARKPVGWLKGEIKTPPFSSRARIEAGYLLGRLQAGEILAMPHSRPMPGIGPRCHELRVKDARSDWRIIYRLDPDVVLVVAVFEKRTRETPQQVMTACRSRLQKYDVIAGE